MKKLISLSIAVLVLLAASLPLFIKVRLICKSQFGDCPGEVSSKVQSQNGKSLFEVRRQIKKILKSSSQVSDFSTQFKLPATLLVDILIVKPEFAIFDKDSGKTLLVDKSGSILGMDDSSPLPTVVQSGDIPNILALNLIKGVYEMYGVSRGEITNLGLVIELPGPVKVIFPVEGADSQVLLGSLRLVYTKITTGEMSGKYSEIDLRFKNPVLR